MLIWECGLAAVPLSLSPNQNRHAARLTMCGTIQGFTTMNDIINKLTAADVFSAHAKPYADVRKAWHVKLSGPLPSDSNYAAAIAVGYKRHGKQALWFAMTLRPEGASVTQFTIAGAAFKGEGSCGPAHNKLREVKSRGMVSVVQTPGTPMTWAVKLTARGQARLDKLVTDAIAGTPAMPAKAKGKAPKAKAVKRTAKPRKPVAVPVEAPPQVERIEPTGDQGVNDLA